MSCVVWLYLKHLLWGSSMVDIYDDILNEKDAKFIHNEMSSIHMLWKYYHNSVGDKEQFHLNRNLGNTDEEIEKNGFGWIFPMWENLMHYGKLQEKYDINTYRRIYFNGHVYGMEPLRHKDDGDFTMIYYPRLDWKKEWGGGTAVWKDEDGAAKLADYKGNRLIVFPARNYHQAQPVSRECQQLRPVIVFKTFLIGNKQNILEDYLKELGCHKVYHGKGKKYTLFDHLYSVSKQLKNNDAPQYLQDAGLFHSVYGTTYFKPKMTQDREVVRSLIGDKAENLVYLFCNMKHPRKENIELIKDDEVREDLLNIERANAAAIKKQKHMQSFFPTVEVIDDD